MLDATAEVRAATAALIADAQANGPVVEPGEPELSVTPAAATAAAGTAPGSFVVAAEGAAAVTVSVPAGYAMFQDAGATTPIPNQSSVPSGSAVWVTGPGVTGPEPVLTARASVTVQRGSVYLYSGNTPSYETAQPLVLADTAQLDATVTASAAFYAAGDLTVHKVYTGEAVGEQGAARLVIDCGADHTFTVEIPARVSTTQTARFPGIPVGRTCTVTEPVTGTAGSVAVFSDAPQAVTMVDRGAEVTVTNTVVRRQSEASGGQGSAGGAGTPTPEPTPDPAPQEPGSGGDDALPEDEPGQAADAGAQLAVSGGVAPWSTLAVAVGAIGIGVLLTVVARARRRTAD